MAEKKQYIERGDQQKVEVAEGRGGAEGAAEAVENAAKALQAHLDEVHEQGFEGRQVDPTDRANYTVAGVTSGAPTPETDEDAAAEAQKAVRSPF